MSSDKEDKDAQIQTLKRECERLRAELHNSHQLALFWRRYNDDCLRDAMHDFNCGLSFGPMCGCIDCRISGRAETYFDDGDENGRCMFAPRFTAMLEYYGLGNIALGAVGGADAGIKVHLSAVVMSGVYEGVDPAADFHCANGNPSFTMFSYGPAVWGCTSVSDDKLRRLRRLFATLESPMVRMEEDEDEDEEEEEDETEEDEEEDKRRQRLRRLFATLESQGTRMEEDEKEEEDEAMGPATTTSNGPASDAADGV